MKPKSSPSQTIPTQFKPKSRRSQTDQTQVKLKVRPKSSPRQFDLGLRGVTSAKSNPSQAQAKPKSSPGQTIQAQVKLKSGPSQSDLSLTTKMLKTNFWAQALAKACVMESSLYLRELHGAPPHGSAKRRSPPKAARSAALTDSPKIAERRRRDRLGSHGTFEARTNKNMEDPCTARVNRIDGNNPQG